ncbi:hypothetical protein ACFVTC_41870 [Streptomyces sp. NPDC057950]|uniref:hypothetical protein n=1 Tax=Streptomyces sp. NPDC057950 TaxID=3346288 RepID=UPI0036F0758F
MTTSSESHRGLSPATLLSCGTLHVIHPATDELSSAERAFMINATEIDTGMAALAKSHAVDRLRDSSY